MEPQLLILACINYEDYEKSVTLNFVLLTDRSDLAEAIEGAGSSCAEGSAEL